MTDIQRNINHNDADKRKLSAINEELRNALKSALRKQDKLQRSLDESKSKLLKPNSIPPPPSYQMGQAEHDLGSILEQLKQKNQNLTKERKQFKKRSQYYKEKTLKGQKELHNLKLAKHCGGEEILKSAFRHEVHKQIFIKLKEGLKSAELQASLEGIEKYVKTRERRIADLGIDLKKERKSTGLMDKSNEELAKEVEAVCGQNEELARNNLLLENELRAAREHNDRQKKEKQLDEMRAELELKKKQSELATEKRRREKVEVSLTLKEKGGREERRLRSMKETELLSAWKQLTGAEERVGTLGGLLESSRQNLRIQEDKNRAQNASMKTVAEQLAVVIQTNIENEKKIERMLHARRVGKNLDDEDFSKEDYIYYKHQFENLEVRFVDILPRESLIIWLSD